MKKINIISLISLLFASAIATYADAVKTTDTLAVSIDCAKNIGKIKALNGVNFGPKIDQEDILNRCERDDFRELNVQSVRLHDCPGQCPALQLVDTNLIFPLMHLDAKDPRNYIFKDTDDYLKAATENGEKIIYRLGITIDHSRAKNRTEMPDAEKWAEVCCQIIAHYNEGWANGFKMNIEHWEIWNEHELVNRHGRRPMWKGTNEQFYDFYIKTSKIIKARYPHLKIGGPAFTHASSKMLPFLKKVSQAKAPLDFLSYHYYDNSISKAVMNARIAKKFLVEHGFPNAEIHLNEYHYMPVSWKELRENPDNYYIFQEIDSGVWNTALMTALQDAPMDVCNFYAFGAGLGVQWGTHTSVFKKKPIYYPFKAFGKLVKFPNRIATSTSGDGVYALAGKNSDGKTALLVSLFKVKNNEVEIDFKNTNTDLSKAKVWLCDKEKNLEEATDVKLDGSKIKVGFKGEYACVYIEL